MNAHIALNRVLASIEHAAQTDPLMLGIVAAVALMVPVALVMIVRESRREV